MQQKPHPPASGSSRPSSAMFTRLLLAVLALGLIANALLLLNPVERIQAQSRVGLGIISMTCKGALFEPGKTIKLECAGTQL